MSKFNILPDNVKRRVVRQFLGLIVGADENDRDALESIVDSFLKHMKRADEIEMKIEEIGETGDILQDLHNAGFIEYHDLTKR